MYSVVVFAPDDLDGDDEVEAVPSVWLSPRKSHCHWPPFRSQESVARAMREQKMPDANSWSSHGAKVLRTYGKCICLQLRGNSGLNHRHYVM